MPTDTTTLTVARRDPSGSRAVRRLRRDGNVPGIVYGGGEDPIPFQVGSRELRIAMSNAGAVLDLKIDGSATTPVVVKELARHPVTGYAWHLDLLRVSCWRSPAPRTRRASRREACSRSSRAS
jgi:large subunit ribosomal protein L25